MSDDKFSPASEIVIISARPEPPQPPQISWEFNPLDLRPALDKLETMIRDRAGSGRLIVLLGEYHDMPAHRIFQQGIMGRLLGTSSPGGLNAGREPLSIALGLEWPCTMLGNIIEEKCAFHVPFDMKVKMAAEDVDGHDLMYAFRAFDHKRWGAMSEGNRIEFCRRNGISVRANDTAFLRWSSMIDPQDPLLKNSMRLPADACRRPGMAIRNEVIAERALAHKRESRAQVYIQHCGAGHIFGWAGSPFNESLTARFQKAGMDVLPVYLTPGHYDYRRLPKDIRDVMHTGLTVNLGYENSLMDELETHYLGMISAASRGDVEIFPKYCENRLFMQGEVKRLAQEWIAAQGPKPKEKIPPAPNIFERSTQYWLRKLCR